MKSISFKVEDKVKKQIGQIAKKHRMTITNFMNTIILNALQKGEAATTLYDSDKDLIKSTIKNFTKKGLKANHLIETEMGSDDYMLYAPNVWLLEAEDAVKMIGVETGILKRLKIRDYDVVDREHTLMKKAIRDYNYRAKEKVNSAEELAEKVFRRKSDNPLVLIQKLDPLKLSKFCKVHNDKKVFYVFGSQDVKVNRQVS